MKTRIIIGIFTFAAALSLGVWSYCTVNSLSYELITQATQVRSDAEKGDVSGVENLCKSWEDDKIYFSYFLKHADADMLNRYFNELSSGEIGVNPDNTVKILNELEAFLKVTYEGEKLKLQNIF